MAKITQDPNPTNDPNYMGYAQDLEKQKSFSAFGSTLEGLGNIVGPAAKAGYNIIQGKIEDETYKRVDQERNANGVDLGTDAAAAGVVIGKSKGDPGNFTTTDEDGTTTTVKRPTGFDEFDRRIGTLQQAYDEGRLSNVDYTSRLNNHVREMIGKYGEGWRHEIDQSMERIAGMNPANALRKAIVDDLDRTAKAANAQANKDEAFVRQNLEYIPPGMLKAWQTTPGNKQLFNSIMSTVADRQRDKAETAQEHASLNLDKAKNEATDDKYNRVAEKEANTFVRTSIADGLSSPDGALKHLRDAINSDKAPDAKEQEQLRAGFAQMKYQMRNSLRAKLNAPVYDTFARDKKEKIIDQSLKEIDDLEVALTNKDTGVLHRTAMYLEAQKNQDTRTLLDDNEWARKARAVAGFDRDGTILKTMLMNPQGPAMIGIVEAGRQIGLMNLVTGEKGVTENLQMFRDGAKRDGTKDLATPAAIRAQIQDTKNQIINAKDNPEQLKNIVKGVFGPGQENFVTKNFSRDSQMEVWTTLASPQVTKALLPLKDTDPASWNMYAKTVTDGFTSQMKRAAADIQKVSTEYGSYVKVDWNPEKLRFDVNFRPGMEDAFRQAQGRLTNNRYDPRSVADEFNHALSIVKPIIEANGDMSMNYRMLDIIHAAGVDTTATTKDNIFQAMGSAVQKWVVGETDPDKNPYRFNQLGQRGAADQNKVDGISFHEPAAGPEAGHTGVLGVIRRAEAGDVKNAYRKVWGTKNEYPLDSMTLDQVQALQRQMRESGSQSTAVGAYQFIGPTLQRLRSDLGLSGNEKFDSKLQDRLATSLLKGRGYDKWQAGEITRKQFVDRLAKEWAGLPNTEGKSHYEGDGLNRATIKLRELLDALPQPKKVEDKG